MDATAQVGPGVGTDDGAKRVNLRAVLSPPRVVTSLILRVSLQDDRRKSTRVSSLRYDVAPAVFLQLQPSSGAVLRSEYLVALEPSRPDVIWSPTATTVPRAPLRFCTRANDFPSLAPPVLIPQRAIVSHGGFGSWGPEVHRRQSCVAPLGLLGLLRTNTLGSRRGEH